MAFSFWEYHFFFLEIFTFLCYANDESDDVIGGPTKTWHQKCTSQKEQNDTYYVVAMATFSAPVSFCEKPNIPIYNLLKWDRGSCSAHR